MTHEEFEFSSDRPPAADDGQSGTGHAPRPARVRDRRGPWLLAGVVLILLGSITAPDRPLLLGYVHGTGMDIGISDIDMTSAPSVTWTADATNLIIGASGEWDGEMIVGVADDVTAGHRLLDASTGREIVDLDALPQPVCTVHGRPVCVSGVPEDPRILVFESNRPSEVRHPGARWALAVGEAVVVLSRSGGAATVARLDADGSTPWRTAIPAGFEAEPFLDTPGAVPTLPWTVVDGVLYLQLGDISAGNLTLLGLDLETGEILTAAPSSDVPVGIVLGDGVLTLDPSSDAFLEGELLRPEGRALFEGIWVDDDMGGPIRVQQVGPDLLAQRRDDGTPLWRSTSVIDAGASAPVVLARVGGVLVVEKQLAARFELAGWDLLSGQELWAREDWVPGSPVVSDGSVIVLQAPDGLIAVDLHSGTPLWRMPGAAAVQLPLQTPDGLVVWFEGGRVALLTFPQG